MEEYRVAIHLAVSRCAAVCEYRGEAFDWTIIGIWSNSAAQAGGAPYKRKFARMPTVDHVHGVDGRPTSLGDLRVISWELNDAKGDLSFEQFETLCRRVVGRARRPGAG